MFADNGDSGKKIGKTCILEPSLIAKWMNNTWNNVYDKTLPFPNTNKQQQDTVFDVKLPLKWNWNTHNERNKKKRQYKGRIKKERVKLRLFADGWG